jgi:DNA primase small subunit
MWVYSGRRGVHCWVSDVRARKLSSEVRSAIAEYLSVIKGGEQQQKKVFLHNELHPSLHRAWSILEPHFENLVLQQNLLKDLNLCKKMLNLVPNKLIRDQLLQKWTDYPSYTSYEKWVHLSQELEERNLKKIKQEIIFQYSYPRLDINVSKQIHHLLKALI